jgi:hypothetical protein
VEEFFAIWTSFFEEPLDRSAEIKLKVFRYRRRTNILCHDDRADHTGAEVALLAWGNEVFGHGEIVGDFSVKDVGSKSSDVKESRWGGARQSLLGRRCG